MNILVLLLGVGGVLLDGFWLCCIATPAVVWNWIDETSASERAFMVLSSELWRVLARERIFREENLEAVD